MDEARNNVFARAALACNKDGNIGGGYSSQPQTKRLHGFRVAENYIVRRNLAERLCQRIYRKCRHKLNASGEECSPHALKVHPEHQTEEESRATPKIFVKRSAMNGLG